MRADRQEQDLKFTRRALLMAGAGGLAFLCLGARLYSLQVLETERYRLMSEDNQFNFNLLPPSRGRILDRFGVAVADNRDSYRVLLVPEQAGDVASALDRLQPFLPLGDYERERILRTARSQRSFHAITVADDLDWHTFASINLNAPDLAGVTPDVGEVRSYAYGPSFAHVIGYVQPPNDEDIANNPRDAERLLRHPGFRVGKTGVEVAREMDLRGQAGALKTEVNARGRVIRELPEQSTEPVSGRDVVLTLDADIQRYAHERLGQESGSAVVMDVNTGELIAMVSTPSFDPNLFVGGISTADYAALRENDRNPLFQKSIQGTYPPGSTFKAVVAAAALEHEVIPPTERINCTGSVRLGNREFHCWRRRGHGPVNLRDAVKTSCDIYFYEIAERLGIDRLHAMATRFGIGEQFDIGISGVRRGTMPDAAWKRARYNEGWSTGDTYNTGIGQGYVTASPLQLAVMTARVASGRAVSPTLYRNAMMPPASHIGVSDAALASVRDGLRAVVEEPGGTSYSLGGLGLGDIEMAGKTGTAQVYSITAAERESGVRDQADLPWRLRDHGLFMCYAPADQPKYACVVVIEHGGGSSAATRPARDILQRVVARDPSSRAGVFADVGRARSGGA
ncbi:peptidoglycan glycosyltransferase [Maricaulis maris MCS10]|uniref:Peptidoglycan glycosyltransferase n=1 Tax=Maricaulis maris (strain MCS10) TaxID=394221 RepID=Q0AN31_MARMM|nr:penicillin-binding protein 2 [Maricaulis maris]ABI66306.1 peptidoglycan glycosyltransferase [Maricaulis maris MCS10]